AGGYAEGGAFVEHCRVGSGGNAMSGRIVERALARLAAPGAILAERASGGFGVFTSRDSRRRPLARLTNAQVRALAAEGAIRATDDGALEITEAGRARVRRESAREGESYAAQHHAIEDRF